MIKSFILSMSLAITFTAFGQKQAQEEKLQLDKNAIKSMCGCYSITFDYTETFATDSNYKLQKPYHAKADAEWIFVEEETDEKIVLQHLLVIQDTGIVKHWRQDWLFENKHLYTYQQDKTWTFETLSEHLVKQQWTQKVYQVDDSPRYEGSATWVHLDGKSYWESTTDAPLPRREFTKRSDYNVMRRTNRHELTPYGWVHEQDNQKIIRTASKDSLIVEEKGYNKYTRIDDKHCQLAKEWWEKNQGYWKLVRHEWDRVFNQQQDLKLISKVNDKLLWKALFELGDELAEVSAVNPKEASIRIEQTIKLYLQDRAAKG